VRSRLYLTEQDVRSERLRSNEQIKAFATILGQFGAALIGASAVRIYDELSLDSAAFFWLFVACVLIWLMMWSLGKLEAD
jgi:hypothetical protein